MSAQPHPYDLYQYNNGNDRDFYFTKVPYSIAHDSDIYTPKNLQSLWNHYDLADAIYTTARNNSQQIDQIPKTFSIDHLKEINRLLTEGVLRFPGELRVVDLFINDEASYATVGKLTHSNIFNSLEKHITSVDLQTISKQHLATILGNANSCLSYTHPFRFVNNLTTDIFISHIVNETPFTLDFKQIPKDVLNRLSTQSAIDSHHRNQGSQEISIRPGKIGELYWQILTPKVPPQHTASQAQRKALTRSHEQLAKRVPPPGHHRPGPPHLGR